MTGMSLHEAQAMTKRKLSYAQAQALERAQAAARASRRRTAADAASPPVEPEHEHRFGDWTCRFVASGYERRDCKCGAFQSRSVRL